MYHLSTSNFNLGAAHRFEHVTQSTKTPYWLSSQSKTIFKNLLTVYKALNDLSPWLISDWLTNNNPIRPLRSSGVRPLVSARVLRSITTVFNDKQT